MYPFTFKVTYWAYDECEKSASGVLIAKDFSDAAHQIEDAFNDELISINRLYCMEESNLIYFGDTPLATAEQFIDMVEAEN